VEEKILNLVKKLVHFESNTLEKFTKTFKNKIS